MINNLLLKNLKVINPFRNTIFSPKCNIFIKNGIIYYLGTQVPQNIEFDQIIDMQGKIVLPGMINAHTHLYSALALGMPQPSETPANFTEILERIWWKLDLALDEKSTIASFESGLLECLRYGVTTVIDHHSSPNFIDGSLTMLTEVAEQFGINISPTFEISDRNGEQRYREGLQENISAMRLFEKNPFVHPLIGLHASFTLSDDSLKQIRAALEGIINWGIHIHVAEDKVDHKDALKCGFNSVIQRLNHFGLINENSLIIHGIYLLPEDLEILKESGAMLVHNPTSNANNRVGMLSSETINKLECGLGTDGMQANMLAEAKEGTLIRSSHLTGTESNVNYTELLFKNNPRIATKLFGRKIGRIEQGYAADLAFYDYHSRSELNVNNLAAHILFGLGKPTDVMTQGRFRIRDNHFLDIDEDDILRRSQNEATKLWNKLTANGY